VYRCRPFCNALEPTPTRPVGRVLSKRPDPIITNHLYAGRRRRTLGDVDVNGSRLGLRRGTNTAFVVYVVVLSAAYYYNLTLVQLGVIRVGTERLGVPMETVAAGMGLLAAVTLAVTLATGFLIDRKSWGTATLWKCRVLFAIVVLQVAVTYLLTTVSSLPEFLLWIVGCSILLGAAIPFAFSLVLDLIAPGERGYAAGAAVGCAFFVAALVPYRWTVGQFVPAAVVALLSAALVLGVVSVGLPVGKRTVRADGGEHGELDGAEPVGVRSRVGTASLLGGVVLLFGAFFVDSLGFVRIVETPSLVERSWQSRDLGVRVAIGLTHVAGGLVAGVLYTKGRYLWILGATFALFALAQGLYVYDIVVGGPPVLGTIAPLLYVLAVSGYTTVAFALWPDVATPETIGRYTAVGIGVGAWAATFGSTALAVASEQARVGTGYHLAAVGVLAVVFLALTGAVGRLLPRAGGR